MAPTAGPDGPTRREDEAQRVVATERLRLRRLSEDDAPFMLRLLNEPPFLKYIGDKGVRTLEDARRNIADGPLLSYARNGFGMYLVERLADHVPVGICGLLRRDHLDDVDIGFAIISEHCRHGYGFEAASAVMGYARLVLGLKRIVAVVNPDNVASIQLLGKLGLRQEGTVRMPGEDRDILLFA